MAVTREWQDTELDYLAKTYPAAFPQEMPRLFPDRSVSAIKQRANLLGIRRGPRKVFFPREFNSLADGGYVSGLTDGEGSFIVGTKERNGGINYSPKFSIRLRIDDNDVLLWLIKYFGCGNYTEDLKHKSPAAIFTVSNLYDILSSVIPHFEAFPLRAKKRKDYFIWKELVELQAEWFRRPWPDAVRERMESLYRDLRAVRRL